MIKLCFLQKINIIWQWGKFMNKKPIASAVKCVWQILYNYQLHCRSICGFMDQCQVLSTKDKESDIDLACKVDITFCVWGRYHLTCNEVHNSYNYQNIITHSTVRPMAVKKFVYKYKKVNELYIITMLKQSAILLKYLMHQFQIQAILILIIISNIWHYLHNRHQSYVHSFSRQMGF